MSKPRIARHRAEPVKTNSMAAIAKTLGGNAGSMGRQAAVVAAASGLVFSGGVVAQASTAGTSAQANPNNVSAAAATVTANFASVTASPSARVVFETPAAASKPAPQRAATPNPVAAQSTQRQAAAPQAGAAQAAPAPKPSAAPAADGQAGSVGAGIVAAAYAQLGQNQDCTALVRRALTAMGLPTTPMGPEYFRTLGRVLGPGESPKPGDIA